MNRMLELKNRVSKQKKMARTLFNLQVKLKSISLISKKKIHSQYKVKKRQEIYSC